jgi:hypothetical protein
MTRTVSNNLTDVFMIGLVLCGLILLECYVAGFARRSFSGGWLLVAGCWLPNTEYRIPNTE